MLRSYGAGLAIGAVAVGGFLGVEHLRHQPHATAAVGQSPVFDPTRATPPHATDWPNTYGPLDPTFGAMPEQAPDVCVHYLAMITKLESCEGFPHDSRDAMVEGGRAAVAAWRELEVPVPAEALQRLSEGCDQSVDALVQTMAAACPAEISNVP